MFVAIRGQKARSNFAFIPVVGETIDDIKEKIKDQYVNIEWRKSMGVETGYIGYRPIGCYTPDLEIVRAVMCKPCQAAEEV